MDLKAFLYLFAISTQTKEPRSYPRHKEISSDRDSANSLKDLRIIRRVMTITSNEKKCDATKIPRSTSNTCHQT